METITLILTLAGFIPYIYTIFRKVNPNTPTLSTWIVYFVLDLVAVYGLYKANQLNPLIIGCSVGAGITCLISIIYGERRKWDKTEMVCLTLGLVGAILIVIFQNYPLLGVCCSLVGVSIASYPMFKKAWFDPLSEDKLSWLIFFSSCLSTLIGLKEWSFNSAAQPITFTAIETTMVYLLVVRPLYLPKVITPATAVDGPHPI